ncbi:MAG: hypothetical protein A4E52_01829 [Pelotomaculum sp. PtaB.Bin013]|nr:MAG: hypothetical protein A4E52_01829 [Pelotomaculum sp. PtaB.Bin013]
MNKQEWYSRIVVKLYAYPLIESAIAHLKAQIELITQSPDPDTDLWIEKKDRLLAKIALKQAEKKAIGDVLERLDQEERELVEKWYFQGWKLKHREKKIWKELKICRSEFYRRKTNIIHNIAVWLGEVDS